MREVESRHEGLHTYRWQMGGRENFLVAGRHAPQQLQLREVSEDGLSRGDRSLRGVHAPLFPIKMPEYFSREPFCFREGAFVVSICLPGTILTGFFGKKDSSDRRLGGEFRISSHSRCSHRSIKELWNSLTHTPPQRRDFLGNKALINFGKTEEQILEREPEKHRFRIPFQIYVV